LYISSKISLNLKKRAAQIKVLLMDVDGTMTDGGVTLLRRQKTWRSKLKPSTRTPDRVSLWPTLLGFARVASLDIKALLSFGVHGK
jgi:hypothetical protein